MVTKSYSSADADLCFSCMPPIKCNLYNCINMNKSEKKDAAENCFCAHMCDVIMSLYMLGVISGK